MEQPGLYVRWFEEITIEDVPLVGGMNDSLREIPCKPTGQWIRILNGFFGSTACPYMER